MTRLIFSRQVAISPEKSFTENIQIEGDFELTELYTEMTNTENDELLVSYQPVQIEKPEKLPEEVKRPEPPEKIATVEELFLTGSRILQFHNPTLNAMDYFNEALKRDPNDIRTNTAVGTVHLKNREYEKARGYFATAIHRLTKDYTRPANCEALYLQGLTLKALGLIDEATDTLYRATWDYAWHSAAYIELARISVVKGDFEKALEQVNESLSTNTVNNSAIALKAGILRKLGRVEEAKQILEPLILSDPLDFRTRYERYLLENIEGETEESAGLLAELNVNMRYFVENYRELANGYLNDGFVAEAENILLSYPYENPMVMYYLGYFQDLKDDKNVAKNYFAKASSLSTDYVFPFRAEDEKVLLKVIEYSPKDAIPQYYLGNLLFDKQAHRAIEYWEKSVQLDPSLAIAWRNLGWGYNYVLNDIQKSISAYEKAIKLKNDEPIYYAELDVLYERNNSPLKTRAKLFESANEIVKKRDDAFVREILVLNLTGQADKSVQYLEGSNFHFREGSSRISDMTVDARLLNGLKFMKNGQYQMALEQYLAAINREAEDEQAGARDPQINYFIATDYEALGNKEMAKQYFQKSTDQNLNETGIISYYQGLSFQKLGQNDKADKLFKALIEEGNNRMNNESEIDFFAKFGERESAKNRISNANLLVGLGLKGLGKNKEAKEKLQKAVELSVSNLWAGVELKGL